MNDNHPNKGKSYWGIWKDYKPPSVDKTTGERLKVAYRRGDTWAKIGRDYGFSNHRLAYVFRTLGLINDDKNVRTPIERRNTAYRARARKYREAIIIEFAEGSSHKSLSNKYKLPEKYIKDLLLS